MTMPHPDTVPLSQLGAILGRSRSYAYQLRDEGRLVLTDDGQVRVADSIARIAATADPAKRGVAERHARARALDAVQPPPPPADQADPADDEPADPATTPGGYNFQHSKAKREHYAAERERIDYQKEARELIEATEHVAAFARAGATLRAGLEAWAAMLPPQLVGRDEAAIRATIADQVEQLLRELTAQITGQAQAPDATA